MKTVSVFNSYNCMMLEMLLFLCQMLYCYAITLFVYKLSPGCSENYFMER